MGWDSGNKLTFVPIVRRVSFRSAPITNFVFYNVYKLVISVCDTYKINIYYFKRKQITCTIHINTNKTALYAKVSILLSDVHYIISLYHYKSEIPSLKAKFISIELVKF